MKKIYLDNAATTKTRKEVVDIMRPFFDKDFGNPSSIHSSGKRAKEALDGARETIAKILDCRQTQAYFTSGGTESDNLAILGIARANKDIGNHIIVSKIEHSAVLEPAKRLIKEGFDVSFVNVDKDGVINLADLKGKIKKETVLISIMHANNEMGSIQPIKEIAAIIRKAKKFFGRADGAPYFHTDACQSASYMDLNVARLGVDALTFSGSKIYGPKGVGILYLKKGVKIEPFVFGGGQERGLRSGTENVAFAVGLSRAFELAQKEKAGEFARLSRLRDYATLKILKSISKSFLNGGQKNRLPNNINITIKGVEGERLVLYLDSKGVEISTGSACSYGSLEPSHVLLSMGLSKDDARSSVRISLGRETTKTELDWAIGILVKVVKKWRSPA